MKILVTGGAGFIGSNLVNQLTIKHEVVVLDNLSTGKISNLNNSGNLTVIEGDITDRSLVETIFKKEFDLVYHLAAIASVAASIDRPIYCNKVNFQATLHILEQVRKHKDKTKLVFASSAAVYGNNHNIPLKETSSISPLSPYAIDKYASESYIINYCKLYGIKASVARFFNVYGPKQDPNSPYSGVISILVDAFLENNKEFNLFGDGKQSRDFIYVDDLVNGLLLMGISKESDGKIFNLGTGLETSIMEVVEYLEKINNKFVRINRLPEREGDIKRSNSDINEIKNLGFNPSFDVYEGLKRLCDYELKNRLLV